MYKIRRATLEDIEEIAAIMADNFDGAMPEHSLPVREFCKQHSSADRLRQEFSWREMYVAGNIAGHLGSTGSLVDFGRQGHPRICLSNFFVRPELHGKGLGRQLLHFLVDTARQRKLRQLQVPSSRTGLEFYRHFGFTVDAVQPPEDVALEITWMTKVLS